MQPKNSPLQVEKNHRFNRSGKIKMAESGAKRAAIGTPWQFSENLNLALRGTDKLLFRKLY